MHRKLKLILFCILSGLLVFPVVGHTAGLFMDPAVGRLGPGDEQRVAVHLTVDEGCVNTVEATIAFPSDYLRVENVLTGNSLLHIWVDKPSNSDLAEINRTGKLHLAGGIPGGYCGRIPGDPGESDIVAEIVFAIPGMIMAEEEKDELDIEFADITRVLMNDGQGTEGSLAASGTKFFFSEKATGTTGDWQSELASDRIKPEPFVIELHQDKDVYDGQYFIVFSTVDKQTGLDHYEVLELAPGEEQGVAPDISWWENLLGLEKQPPEWKTAKTPYLLEDQTLESIVKVKAVDKAGNERIVEYIPDMETSAEPEPSDSGGYMLLLIAGIFTGLVLILFSVYWFIIRPKRHKDDNIDSNDKEEYNQG